jgi:hypothetical protein
MAENVDCGPAGTSARPHRRVRIAIATAVVLAASVLSAAPVAAADTTPPQLVDVQLSTNTVSVSGLNSSMVVASVHLTDDVEVCASCSDMGGGSYPYVVMSRTDGKWDARILTLASGTVTDGTWTTTFPIPSTYDGDWRVSEIGAFDTSLNLLDIDPSTHGMLRTLHVTGTHQPRLSFGFAPRPVSRGQRVWAKGRLTYADTGAPIPNQPLTIGFDSDCAEPGGAFRLATDPRGYYSYSYIVTENALTCVFLVTPSIGAWLTVAHVAYRSGTPPTRFIVTAIPQASAVRLGGHVTVAGKVVPNGSPGRVYLERWSGTRWTIDGYASIRTTSGYTLTLTPHVKGTFRYRVVKLSQLPDLFGGVSKAFLVTAR